MPRWYRPGVGFLVVAVLCASACGSSQTDTGAPSTTVTPNDPDRCPAIDTSRLPAVNPPSEAARQQARQQLLIGDADRARQYGQGFPDSFNDVWFDFLDGDWVLVVGFKNGLDEHKAALLARLEHVDRVLVCRTERSIADRQRIMAELAAIANRGQVFTSYSVGIERTAVNLRADQEKLAKELYDKYSPTIDVTVGLFPYPPADAGALNIKCPVLDAVAPPSGLRISVEPASRTFASGTGSNTTVRVRNQSATRYSGSQGNIYLVLESTRTVVGVNAGARDLVLRTFDAPAGGESTFEDVLGSAPCAWEGSYTLPKGAYETLATVNVDGVGMVFGEPTRVELT